MMADTATPWTRLVDAWRRYWAQLFLGWALAAHADEIVGTFEEAFRAEGWAEPPAAEAP